MPHHTIALLGFGNVGQALARLLLRKRLEMQSHYDLTFTVTGISTGRHGAAIDHQGLDLEKAGVQYSSKGIEVNDKLQTTAPNIYAIGDVVGSYQFSHIAEYHAGIAVPNALLPLPIKRKVNYENMDFNCVTSSIVINICMESNSTIGTRTVSSA